MTRRFRSLLAELWLPVLLVALWWLASANSTAPFFPPLSTIVSTFKDTWGVTGIQADLLPSLERYVEGLAIGSVVGITLGIPIGLSNTIRKATEPFTDFFRVLPSPVLVPIAVVLLGVGSGMKVMVISFGVLWPVLLNTIDGVRGLDPLMMDMSRAFNFSRWGTIRRVVFPAALPQIFAGLRVALSIGLIVMVVAEMLASTNGLGHFVLLSQQTFAIPQMWAGILMLGILGYVSNVIFVMAERRVLRWHRGWRAANAQL